MGRGFGPAQRYALIYLTTRVRVSSLGPDCWTAVRSIADAYAAGAAADEAATRPRETGQKSPYPQATRARVETIRCAVRVLARGGHVDVTYIDRRLCARPKLGPSGSGAGQL